MGVLISMADFMTTRQITVAYSAIARDFRDEHGYTLEERERRTIFGLPGGGAVRYGEPGHREMWMRYEADLLAEVGRLVAVMSGASNSAWVAAVRIIGVIGPARRPRDFDPDTMI